MTRIQIKPIILGILTLLFGMIVCGILGVASVWLLSKLGLHFDTDSRRSLIKLLTRAAVFLTWVSSGYVAVKKAKGYEFKYALVTALVVFLYYIVVGSYLPFTLENILRGNVNWETLLLLTSLLIAYTAGGWLARKPKPKL